jgi:tripartite-type tricarboxylate transporter receptor subunit TctC
MRESARAAAIQALLAYEADAHRQPVRPNARGAGSTSCERLHHGNRTTIEIHSAEPIPALAQPARDLPPFRDTKRRQIAAGPSMGSASIRANETLQRRSHPPTAIKSRYGSTGEEPMTRNITRRTALAGLAATVTLPGIAKAQTWPSRVVTMVVPFPAGGNADALARSVAAELSVKLGQQFIVENRGGAGGNIGGGVVAHAAPDGYTFLFGTPAPIAMNKLMYKTMAYDPEKDFTPVALVAKSPLIIVANPKAPFNTIKELAVYAKANPGKLNVGHPGNGTLGHITSVLLQRQLKISMTGVPYRGTAPLTVDLLGGQVDVGMDFMTTYVPLVKAGKLKALAVTSAQRAANLPEVMTVQEGGFEGFEATAWYAIVAPAKTPTAIIDKINAASNAFLASDNGKKVLLTFGMQAAGGTPADLKNYIASELKKWGPVIKEANISM